MFTIKLNGLWLAAGLPMAALAAVNPAADTVASLLDECSAYSQAGMRDCLDEKARASQKALQQAEDNAQRRLNRWDEDKKYIALARGNLAAASQQFSHYRDAQCQFEFSLSGGAAGDSHEIRRLACVAALNSHRTAQLNERLATIWEK